MSCQAYSTARTSNGRPPVLGSSGESGRAAGSDEALRVVPHTELSLEQMMEFLADDELLEVTPKHLRMRKRYLDHATRMKVLKVGKNV